MKIKKKKTQTQMHTILFTKIRLKIDRMKNHNY